MHARFLDKLWVRICLLPLLYPLILVSLLGLALSWPSDCGGVHCDPSSEFAGSAPDAVLFVAALISTASAGVVFVFGKLTYAYIALSVSLLLLAIAYFT